MDKNKLRIQFKKHFNTISLIKIELNMCMFNLRFTHNLEFKNEFIST